LEDILRAAVVFNAYWKSHINASLDQLRFFDLRHGFVTPQKFVRIQMLAVFQRWRKVGPAHLFSQDWHGINFPFRRRFVEAIHPRQGRVLV